MSRLLIIMTLMTICWYALYGRPALSGTVDGNHFEAGRAAFQAGDTATALDDFLAARKAGMDSPALHYNLGVCYFRLQRYAEAVREFRILTTQPENASVGHYNIGLIALHLGKTAEARAHFRRTLGLNPPAEIKTLAENALRSLPPAPAAKRYQGLISAAAGYDDNVTLESESDLVGVTERGDGFMQLLAGVRALLTGTRDNGVQMEAGGYLRDYQDIDRFNQQAGRFGLAMLRRIGDWSTQLGGHLDLIYLDGERFQTLATATVQATRGKAGRDRLLLRYRLAHIDGGDGFDQISGWRQRLQAEQQLPAGRGHVSLGYALEYNDRNDLDGDTQFISQSPLRNTLYAEAVWPTGRLWEFTLHGDYRHSSYRDEDIRSLPAGTLERQRKDRQYGAVLRVVYKLKPNWRVFGQIGHTRNDSNIPTIDYTRNESQMGMEVYF
jgi:hypothetical protein